MSKVRVLLGMSGGVDSTAACKVLLASGYEVVGATLLTCELSQSAVDEAVALAERLGVEHHVIDVREQFQKTVIDPFVQLRIILAERLRFQKEGSSASG